VNAFDCIPKSCICDLNDIACFMSKSLLEGLVEVCFKTLLLLGILIGSLELLLGVYFVEKKS